MDCSSCLNYIGNSEKIKEFDNYLDKLIEDSFKKIQYGRRDFSKFPRPSESVNDAGMLSYVRMGIDVSLEITLCTKIKFIFSWNNNEFLRSASIDSSDRYKSVTWEEYVYRYQCKW